jgi:hypothetical protein
MTMRRLASIVLVTAVVAGACGGERTPGPNEYALPADPALVLGPNATPLACAGVGLDAVLVGSASDGRKVWLEDAQTADRLELVWPVGFTVRFGQGDAFDVLNAAGKTAIVGGSHVSGACVGADAYWLDDIPQ